MIVKTFTDADGNDVELYIGRPTSAAERAHSVFVHNAKDSSRRGAYLTDDKLRAIRDSIDEHLGDRPKPVEPRVKWRNPTPASITALRERIDADVRRMADQQFWTLPPVPSRTRAEEIVYGIAEAHLAALKKETEK